MNVVHGKITLTAAEAAGWAHSVGALDGLVRLAAEAPPIPEVAADLLRRLDFPAAGPTPSVPAAGSRDAA